MTIPLRCKYFWVVKIMNKTKLQKKPLQQKNHLSWERLLDYVVKTQQLYINVNMLKNTMDMYMYLATNTMRYEAWYTISSGVMYGVSTDAVFTWDARVVPEPAVIPRAQCSANWNTHTASHVRFASTHTQAFCMCYTFSSVTNLNMLLCEEGVVNLSSKSTREAGFKTSWSAQLPYYINIDEMVSLLPSVWAALVQTALQSPVVCHHKYIDGQKAN